VVRVGSIASSGVGKRRLDVMMVDTAESSGVSMSWPSGEESVGGEGSCWVLGSALVDSCRASRSR
jgi:hypothetical protein